MTDEDMNELLGAYALDAVDESERREIEAYLAINPRARAEVSEHREVATLLASTGATAPTGLWDKIAASLDERAPAPEKVLAPVLRLDQQRERKTRRQARPGWFVAGIVAIAACAALGILAVKLSNRNDSLERMPQTAAAQLETAASVAIATPTARKGVFKAADGTTAAQIAIDGTNGYLVAGNLPALPADRTYQLWGLIDEKVISLGVLGSNPKVVAFPADSRLTTLMLTNEAAGGVSVSTQKPVLLSTLNN